LFYFWGLNIGRFLTEEKLEKQFKNFFIVDLFSGYVADRVL